MLLAAMDCVFWYLAHVRPELSWQFPVFYIWVGIFGVLAPAQVWTLANYLLTTREAKRVFGLVGAGAISGWIFSGMLTKALAKAPGLGTESLLLAMAVGLLICAVLVAALWREKGAREAAGTAPHAEPESKSLRESLATIFSSPYLLSIAALITLSSVVTSFAGWQFKAIAKAAYPDKNALTAFFGEFNLWAGLGCLALQLLLTSRFFRRFGLGPALLAVPFALLGGEIAVLASGTLMAAVLLKGADQLLRYSLDKSSVELLFLPIPPAVKLQAKSCIDTFIWRLGDGLAGFTLAIFTDQLHWSAQRVSGVNIVFIGCWIVAAVTARRRYADTLLSSIRERRLDAERQFAPVLDRSTTEILASQLASPDPREVLYALDLFGASQASATHPAVRDLLAHELPAVRKRALEVLDSAGDQWALPRVEEMLTDVDLGVRTEALLFLAHHGHVDPLTRIEEIGSVQGFSITSGMAAFLAQPGASQKLPVARMLMDKLIGNCGEAGKGARLEAAALVGMLPDEFDDQLDALLSDEEPEVVRAAARAAGKLRKRHAARLAGRRSRRAPGAPRGPPGPRAPRQPGGGECAPREPPRRRPRDPLSRPGRPRRPRPRSPGPRPRPAPAEGCARARDDAPLPHEPDPVRRGPVRRASNLRRAAGRGDRAARGEPGARDRADLPDTEPSPPRERLPERPLRVALGRSAGARPRARVPRHHARERPPQVARPASGPACGPRGARRPDPETHRPRRADERRARDGARGQHRSVAEGVRNLGDRRARPLRADGGCGGVPGLGRRAAARGGPRGEEGARGSGRRRALVLRRQNGPVEVVEDRRLAAFGDERLQSLDDLSRMQGNCHSGQDHP